MSPDSAGPSRRPIPTLTTKYALPGSRIGGGGDERRRPAHAAPAELRLGPGAGSSKPTPTGPRVHYWKPMSHGAFPSLGLQATGPDTPVTQEAAPAQWPLQQALSKQRGSASRPELNKAAWQTLRRAVRRR